MTNTKLRRLFDLQRFEGNARLQSVIDSAHFRMRVRELSDDELDSVAAAGITAVQEKSGKKNDPGDFTS